jgi:hypothetical protein
LQECCHNDNSATNSVDILINQVALQLWLNILLYCLMVCFHDSNSMSSWVFRKCLGYFGVLGIVLKMYTQFLIIYLVLVNIIKYWKLQENIKNTWNVTLNQMSQVIKRSEHSNKRKRNNYIIVPTVLYKQLWYSDWTTTLSGSTTVHLLKCSKQNTGNGEDISVQGIMSTFSSVIQLQKSYKHCRGTC